MVSEELFKNIIILYMLTAQGQGNIINVKTQKSLWIRKWESPFY